MTSRRILVFEAHGDDMEFFAGGTIARFTSLGHSVTLVCATDNDKGSFELSALRGDVARVIARRRALLVARLVLLIHHDRAEPLNGREDGRAGTDRDAALAAPERLPSIDALTI